MFRRRRKTALLIPLAFALLAMAASCRYELGQQHAKAQTTLDSTLLDPLFNVFALGDDKAWAIGYYGTILLTEDAGVSWEELPSGTQEALYGIWFTDHLRGWICGSFGTLLATQDGGRTWSLQQTGAERHLFDLHFVDSLRGVAVGLYGTILRTRDGGSTWEDISLGEDLSLNALDFADSDHGWIVGEFGTILRTADFGDTWERQTSPVEEASLYGVDFTSSTTGYASGIDGILLKTLDGGSTWNQEESPIHDTLFSVQIVGNDVWAVGLQGAALHRDPSTQQWQTVSDLPAVWNWMRAVHFSTPQKGWTAGADGMILATRDGKRWTKVR